MKRFSLIPILSLALSLFLSGCHNPPCTLHASSTSEAEAWGIAMPPTPCFTGVPSFPGGGLRAHSDCADGFEQALFRGTTAAMFTDFKTRLGAAGFGRFAQNELNRNLFATYTNDGHIVHAYFTPAS